MYEFQSNYIVFFLQQPWSMISQTVPTQTLKLTSVNHVQEPFTEPQIDSESLLVNGSRTRAAEMVRKL